MIDLTVGLIPAPFNEYFHLRRGYELGFFFGVERARTKTPGSVRMTGKPQREIDAFIAGMKAGFAQYEKARQSQLTPLQAVTVS